MSKRYDCSDLSQSYETPYKKLHFLLLAWELAHEDEDVTEMMTIGRQMNEVLKDREMIGMQENIDAL
jgi:hypothetical protein